MLLSSLCVTAQQKVTQQGNNFQVEKTEKSEDVKTPYTLTIDGKTYPIYKGKRGGFYYYNSNGKKTYVPKEVSEKLKKIYNEK